MFDELKEKLIGFFTSRLTLFTLCYLVLAGILLYRCFELQIIHGQEYLDEFVLEVEKTRDIASTRGNIFDRNGNLLAYNELAYSVKVEDVFESGRSKNDKLNEMLRRLIGMIEKNGDSVITDFKIVVDENGSFAYTAEGAGLMRFLADVYGYATVDKLSDKERASTPDDVMAFLSRPKGFFIGEYENPQDDGSAFLPGKGYTKKEWLQLVTLRYAMKLTSFRKYIGTTVASNVSERTVAVIMENAADLPGVTIVEDTIRRYVDSQYFAHVLGYTGRISSEELTELNARAQEENLPYRYDINDMVGKSGIEAYLETALQGVKGYETVIVDNMGKVNSILDRKEAQAGQDVYLTIDKDLTIAVYNILEQRLAGLVSQKIIDAKEYRATETSSSSDIRIPIYDVYFAMFNNAIVDMKALSQEEAGEIQKEVYQAYLLYKQETYEKLLAELTETLTPYEKLPEEYQVYESRIVSLLNDQGVIVSQAVDSSDPTYIAWAKEEVISLNEYLRYCIAQNWIDASRLDLDDKYSESDEIYRKMLDYIVSMIDNNAEFQKRLYKYMLLNNRITGRQVCQILCEQRRIEVPAEEEADLYEGRLSAYQFMKNRINALDITPAQLALDPCNASVVVTDVHTGDVLAMVSYPGYDNNKMANSVNADYYAMLNADKSRPQYNFATQYAAAPGSTFKMVTATAGLLEDVVRLNTRIDCTGTYTNISDAPRCWNRYGHGYETLTSAIRDSCNFYFYDVGYRLATENGSYVEEEGIDVLYRYADLFGLTERSGVEISETAPEVSDFDPVRSAIGQGNHSYTTVGIARYVTAVANSGTCYELTLLDKITDPMGNVTQEFAPRVRNVIEMPQEYWDAIHLGMRQVVENKVYFGDLAVDVAGKTGTAEQTRSRPSHALFVCYAPYEEPEIAVAARIPFGYSSDYAAQAARDIIAYHYGLEKDLITGTADMPDGGVTNEL